MIQTFEENEWKTVVGLTSFGPMFCTSNIIPGVYTRVSSFIKWIKDEVEKDFVAEKSSALRKGNGPRRYVKNKYHHQVGYT